MTMQTSGYGAVRPQVRDAMRHGRHRQALHLQHCHLASGEAEAELMKDMAECYWALGDVPTTLQLSRKLVERFPDHVEGWSDLGVYLMGVGARDGARSALDMAVRLAPRSARVLAARNFIEPFPGPSRHVQTLRRLAGSSRTPLRDRVLAYTALGSIQDAAGFCNDAFRMYERANACRREPYQKVQVERLVDAQIARCPRFPLTLTGRPPSVVFVCGLPRSGTTLVERVLTRHSQVRSVGESTALRDVLRAYRSHLASTHGRLDYYAWVDFFRDEDLTPFRELYLQKIAPRNGETAPVVVSKLPLDCLEMGFARALVPDARFVFVSRHPLDVGLSLFRTNFRQGNGFTRKLDWIGHMTRHVYRALDDYCGKLGPALRVQSYRALVETPQEEIAHLLAQLGLTFEEACLTPEQGGGTVTTASVLQVRAAINRGGLDRWRRFETQLQPLVEALGGADFLAAWEARDAQARGPAHVIAPAHLSKPAHLSMQAGAAPAQVAARARA